MAKETAISTIDNPYSPFSQFDDWYNYDCEKGYDSCGYLDRVNYILNGETSFLNSEKEDELIEQAIDQLVKYDPTGLYVKVEKLNNNENGKDYKIVDLKE